jgi:hypothetical protein
VIAFIFLKIFLLSAIYPLGLWTYSLPDITRFIKRFHLRPGNLIGGTLSIAIIFIPAPLVFKICIWSWKLLFLAASNYYWKRDEYTPRFAISALSIYAAVIYCLGVRLWMQDFTRILPLDIFVTSIQAACFFYLIDTKFARPNAPKLTLKRLFIPVLLLIITFSYDVYLL